MITSAWKAVRVSSSNFRTSFLRLVLNVSSFIKAHVTRRVNVRCIDCWLWILKANLLRYTVTLSSSSNILNRSHFRVHRKPCQSRTFTGREQLDNPRTSTTYLSTFEMWIICRRKFLRTTLKISSVTCEGLPWEDDTPSPPPIVYQLETGTDSI